MKIGIAKSLGNISRLQYALLVLVLSAPQAGIADDSTAHRQKMVDLGVQHESAWELYQSLKKEAGGGKNLTWKHMPDWTGVWRRHAAPDGGFFRFDRPFDKNDESMTTAKLGPEAYAALEAKFAKLKDGRLYDAALGDCGPPGYPRWLGVPFLREFIVRPEQTWLSSETVNNVRRIYTDGRDHVDEIDRYPLYYGDSIGFWDEHKLVIHTNQLMASSYGRAQPDHTEHVETVEIWEKEADDRMLVKVWVYDPLILLEPWYNEFIYLREPNEDKRLRMRFWNCRENPNNDVFETEDGSTQFSDFSFMNEDDQPKDD